MRKFITIFIGLIIIFAFVSCNNTELKQTNTTVSSVDTISENIDYSTEITPKISNTVRYTEGSLSLSTGPVENIDQMTEISSVIIKGKVESTAYLLKGSDVYTKSEVKVNSCYKGDIEPGKTIIVREIGGFVPTEVYNKIIDAEKGIEMDEEKSSTDSYYDIRVKNYKVMEKDENVILFLTPVEHSDFDEFKDNAYETVRVWQGKLLFDEDNEVYYPYIPKEETDYIDCDSFTLKEDDLPLLAN